MNDSEQQRLYRLFTSIAILLIKRGDMATFARLHLNSLSKVALGRLRYKKIDTKIIGEIEYECTPEDEAFYKQFNELSGKAKEPNRKIFCA